MILGPTIRFDDSLPALVSTIRSTLGEDVLRAGVALRDATGRLSFFVNGELDKQQLEQIARALLESMGRYARRERPIADMTDPSFASIMSEVPLSVRISGTVLRLIDRRLVGSEWLQPPTATSPKPSRIVFFSIKGGVGRSTALSVAGAHLASHGKRVLAIDLDMEAPGLGSILLNHQTLPSYGIIDALVESSLSELDTQFYADLVGPSEVAGKAGRIDVVPAFGKRSIDNPEEILSKLSRAYGDAVDGEGNVVSFTGRLSRIVDALSDPQRYDAVLIDSRAGLHETNAASIQGLGAEVLMFGLNEAQTFDGYSALFAHLARFIDASEPLPDWVERLTMVQGKAPLDFDERAAFSQKCTEMFVRAGLSQAPSQLISTAPLPAEPFQDVPWDDGAADADVLPEERSVLSPIAILDDARFAHFDPIARRDLLSESLYTSTFQDLLVRINEILQSQETSG